jgi:hypothetical protein
VTTDASGVADVTITLPAGAGQDQFITATATDPGNNTSRFSYGVPVDPAGP